ncbi:ATP-binding protein [Beijerinckia sp. L45]|uniref:ATP-binding protein n=1 Tax=Beijerinckia sp. L45 TaxID=1641855 RepID=UPI00131DB281|nr:ATP-binding protein [Beijerinckia sp. L45]
MKSLRLRLFLVLVAATGFVWLAAVVWIYTDSRSQIENILNRRLMEAARMVATLVDDEGIQMPVQPGGSPRVMPRLASGGSYNRHLSCQIWSFDGKLVGASDGAPSARLSDQSDGFSQRTIDGEVWQVFAFNDPKKHIHVLVGDNLSQRTQLERGIVGGVLLTAALILPILALLIWLSVSRGLRPLQQATQNLAARDAENLEPVDLSNAPSEIRPLIDALNRLFGKVVAARDHERSFIAYAAHELRTPLAGLKTQVQVALAARDAESRDKALRQTLLAVDRTARMVQQLLAMSQLDANQPSGAAGWIPVEQRLRDLAAMMDPKLRPQRVAFATDLDDLSIQMDENLFDLAMRNLMENALQMTPGEGVVRWAYRLADAGPTLSLEDDGPGIPAGERDLVVQKFFRGRNKSATGSGLGLAIVLEALGQAGARLQLGASTTLGGLTADVVIPAHKVRAHGQNIGGAVLAPSRAYRIGPLAPADGS